MGKHYRMIQTWGFWQVLPQILGNDHEKERSLTALGESDAPSAPTLHTGVTGDAAWHTRPTRASTFTRRGTNVWLVLPLASTQLPRSEDPPPLGLRSVNTETRMPWPSANREPGSSQAAPEANRSLAGCADTPNPFTASLPAPHPPAPPYLLHLYEFSPSSCSGFTNCSSALLTLCAACRQRSTNSTWPLTAACQWKEERWPQSVKAKRKFYVKRNFFIMVFSFTHVHTKLLPSPPPVKKKKNAGDSLVVQWLGLRAFTAKGPGSIPGRGTEIPQAAQCGQSKKIEVAHCSIIYSSIKQEQNQSIYLEGNSHVNRLKHDTEQAQAKWDENSKWPKRLKV